MYGIELAHQTRLFFMAVGIGFFAGAVFDIFRILRLAVNFGKIAVAIQDVIYILFVFALSFAFLLSKNMGEIRMFAVLGELLGFIIYYLTFGSFVYSIGGRIIEFLRRLFIKVFRIISYPFIKLFGLIRKLCEKIGAALRKTAIKTKNKLILRLQRIKALLYNVFGFYFSRRKAAAAAEGPPKPLSLEERRARIAQEMEMFMRGELPQMSPLAKQNSGPRKKGSKKGSKDYEKKRHKKA
ncbi:MAG TPA: spore cortex biosynthesis protein YabQ [Clostridiales bacterium]|nr:spore cortex biosynthesis protein YabQ [Clostridiales bacterium]HXK82766.1 spore cortex biosynthesis protein YabQ [Clostridiales bacterium]